MDGSDAHSVCWYLDNRGGFRNAVDEVVHAYPVIDFYISIFTYVKTNVTVFWKTIPFNTSEIIRISKFDTSLLKPTSQLHKRISTFIQVIQCIPNRYIKLLNQSHLPNWVNIPFNYFVSLVCKW